MEKKSEDDLVGTASVELIRENEDGSADYMFNFPPEAMAALTRLGIMTAIKAGIDDAKRLNPDVDAVNISKERVVFPDKLRHIAEQAGFLLWDDEEWKPEGALVYWEYEYNDDTLVKFAQLIVRECISRCDDLNSQQYIMQHFGMKESDWT